MKPLRFVRDAYDALRAHGESAYPHESCGVLLGRQDAKDALVIASVRATNVCGSTSRIRYAIAPPELIFIEQDARARGLCILGFYHSHPDHPAQWSPTDLAEAHWIGYDYVITRVAAGVAAETKAFFLAGALDENKCFHLRPVEIVDVS